tara:strand:- start:18 stop:827 length:810 start_codon:yes stop_codon:yes gene_type:complete
MNKKILYGLLAATGIAGIAGYLYWSKKDKKENGGTRSGGKGMNLPSFPTPNGTTTVTDTSEGQTIEINDGANSTIIETTANTSTNSNIPDFSNSGLSPDTVSTETSADGTTTTTTTTANSTVITTESDSGVTTEEIETEDFVDQPYTRQEVVALYAGGHNGLWTFADNYYSGGFSSGNLGFLGRAVNSGGNVFYVKPPYYVGQTIYVRQCNNHSPKYPQYNGAHQIDGIHQGVNGQWMVDTTSNRLGDTPVNPGLIQISSAMLGNELRC